MALALAPGCPVVDGGGDETSAAAATRARDVEFDRTRIEIVDESLAFCPFSGTRIAFEVTGPRATPSSLHTSTLRSSDRVASFPSALGALRAAPGEEVCLEVTAPNWDDDGTICRTIEAGTSRLDFEPVLSRPGGCVFQLELAAEVITFDPTAFCSASCGRLLDCGRPDAGCVESCIEDLAGTEDDEVCFDATRSWLGCLHSAPCVNQPEYFCNSINLGFASEARLYRLDEPVGMRPTRRMAPLMPLLSAA